MFRREPRTGLCLSDASVLELALKSAMGKIRLPEPPRRWVRKQAEIWGIGSLPLSQEELLLSAELPWHHKDPFDRLIVAAAKNQRLPVIASDRIFARYGIEVIW